MSSWYQEYVEVCRQVDHLNQVVHMVELQFSVQTATITKLGAENTFLKAENSMIRAESARLASQRERDIKVIRDLGQQLQLVTNEKRKAQEISQGSSSDDPALQPPPSKKIKGNFLQLGEFDEK